MCCCVPLHKKTVLLLGDQRFHRALHVRMALEIPPFRPTPRCCPPKRVSHQSIVIPLLQCNLGCCEGRKRSQNSAERHATTTQVAGRPGGSAVGGGGWRRGRCIFSVLLLPSKTFGRRRACIMYYTKRRLFSYYLYFAADADAGAAACNSAAPAKKERQEKERQEKCDAHDTYNTSPRGARRINTRARCILYTCPLYSGAFQTPRSKKISRPKSGALIEL